MVQKCSFNWGVSHGGIAQDVGAQVNQLALVIIESQSSQVSNPTQH